eukprot:TRINITY_DN1018_c2_g1_i1.p1 TRINITY_DN1018_c2_g1~~TRINITY_DN1018_c2_g1_i1.p1  ORF type:complete len:240 (+),score=52.58 TRINITY_DN1018_c2_g1_i1:59-721(+)
MGRSPSLASNEESDSESGSSREEQTNNKRRKVAKQPDFNEVLSVDATNALRVKLGMAPLHGTTVSDKPAESNNETKDFNESLSVDATNALRIKLGMKPLYDSTEGEDANNPSTTQASGPREQQFEPEKLANSVSKATQDLKIDTRIGIGKVRAKSAWDDLFLNKKKSGQETKPVQAAIYRDSGTGTIIEPDFEGKIWNCHLTIAATNTIRDRIGLKPLHA